MPVVQRQRISGHSPYEAVFGFSRAVVAGYWVLVAGTAPVPPGGGPPPAEAYAQAKLCLELIGEALIRAGTSLEHVVRTRMFITGTVHWPEVARAHGEVFADIRPAATAVIVACSTPPGSSRSKPRPSCPVSDKAPPVGAAATWPAEGQRAGHLIRRAVKRTLTSRRDPA